MIIKFQKGKAMDIEKLYMILVISLVNNVKEACTLFGGSATSFGRSEKQNNNVGGSKTSWHRDWLAIDVYIDSATNVRPFMEYLQHKNFRVLFTGGKLHDSELCQAVHVQYAWPVLKNFIRNDQYTHLREMVKNFPYLFEEYDTEK